MRSSLYESHCKIRINDRSNVSPIVSGPKYDYYDKQYNIRRRVYITFIKLKFVRNYVAFERSEKIDCDASFEFKWKILKFINARTDLPRKVWLRVKLSVRDLWISIRIGIDVFGWQIKNLETRVLFLCPNGCIKPYNTNNKINFSNYNIVK